MLGLLITYWLVCTLSFESSNWDTVLCVCVFFWYCAGRGRAPYILSQISCVDADFGLVPSIPCSCNAISESLSSAWFSDFSLLANTTESISITGHILTWRYDHIVFLVSIIKSLVVWNMNFMTFHILGIVTPTDFHIFQRGRYTTNQIKCLSLPSDVWLFGTKKPTGECHRLCVQVGCRSGIWKRTSRQVKTDQIGFQQHLRVHQGHKLDNDPNISKLW